MSEISTILKSLKKRGFRFIWVFFIESIWFDIRYGTSTAIRVAKDRQIINGVDADRINGVLYVASFTSVIEKTLNIAKDILGSKRMRVAQFMDLGCGKGKALIVYSRTFGRIAEHRPVGIEYDPILADIARYNIDRVSFSKGQVQIVNDSATNLRKYLVAELALIYLYNPFKGQTFIDTLTALKGTPHLLIYVDPAEREFLVNSGYIILVENNGSYNADNWLIASSFDLK
jgi:SAM-dependent methyltransferase